MRTDLADGLIARFEDGKFRMVAGGFHFTNEIRFDAAVQLLYTWKRPAAVREINHHIGPRG